jgi:oligopeptide transport system substrate-binding protein
LGSLALASCGRSEPYFGESTPPSTQTLIYEISGEPSSFDPATALGGTESEIVPALLEPLLFRQPESLEPAASLATHYEIDANLKEISFFLRGHPSPRGTKLAGAPGKSAAVLWSDGRPVTAEDFVFAWRRLVDPAHGSAYASLLYPVANGKEINEGRARPETLAVRAHGAFTLRVIFKSSAVLFLNATSEFLAPAPRHAVQRHTSFQTQGGLMPSCGPYLLHNWKPYERVVLRKNPRYYDAARIHLDQIDFLPITDGATSVNLYKAGRAYAMHGRAVPPLWIPALRGKKDFHSTPVYRSLFYAFNTTRPPFDNALVRYAFNMATNKSEIARFLSGGQTPARTVIPPSGGYRGAATLYVEAGGRAWEVLSYDPESARELLRTAGAEHLVLDLTFPNRTRSRELAQILQSQWRANLGARVNLAMLEWNVWIHTALSLKYTGVIESGTGSDYADPNGILEFFTGRLDGSGWIEPEFNQLIDDANAEGEAAVRMHKLAACEERLLRVMPVLPLFFDSYSYLRKPYVGGMTLNVLGIPEFRTTWIDTHWRES